MTHARLTAPLLLALCVGCAPNTRCTIGDVMCERDDNQVIECQDASGGGDEDGEFVSIVDCAAMGMECDIEPYGTDLAFVGCVPEGCGAGCILGTADVCSRDEQNVSTCVMQPDGCPRRVIANACEVGVQRCAYDGAGVAGCVDL